MTKELAKLLFLKCKFKNGVYNKSSDYYVAKTLGVSRNCISKFLKKCVNLNWARIQENKLIFNKLECVWDGIKINNVSLDVTGSISDITQRLEAFIVKVKIDRQQYARKKKERKNHCINSIEDSVQISLRRIKSLLNCSKSKANRLMCSLENKGILKITRDRYDGLSGRRITKEQFMIEAKGLFRGCFFSNGKVVKTRCNKYAFL